MSYDFAKRMLGAAAAGSVLVLASPLLALIALLIVLEDGRPVFFSQMRAGRAGQPFRAYKFRTLYTGEHDPLDPLSHATAVGTVLRRHALDEIPQLWNVVRGEMSIVGPRPIYPAEARGYDARQRKRLRVRPGLTGWAQIHGRNDLSWHERVALDVWYVEHRSLALDLRILWRTPAVMLSGEGAYGPGNQDPDEDEVARHARD